MLEVFTAVKEGSEYVLAPKNFTFFHLKLLSDNSASFTSSRMKDLCQKRKVHPGHRKSWNLGRPFSRPGKSWKMTKVVESHGKVMGNDDNVVEFLQLH